MRKQSAKTKKILAHIAAHPLAKSSILAKRFGVHVSRIYQLRKMLAGAPVPEAVVGEVVSDAPEVDAVLDSRAVDYGKFKDGARLMQGMKRLLADHAQAQGKTFADDQWEALEMIVHKIGRIVNGNPDKIDHWTDIAGYATLVADRLGGNAR